MCMQTTPLMTWGWESRSLEQICIQWIKRRREERPLLLDDAAKSKLNLTVERKWMDVSRRFWSREGLRWHQKAQREGLPGSQLPPPLDRGGAGTRGRMWSEMDRRTDQGLCRQMVWFQISALPSASYSLLEKLCNLLCLRGPICPVR